MQKRLFSAIIAIVLLIFGAFLLFSVTAAALHINVEKPAFLFAPGVFLYRSFLFASFYAPLYCFILSFLLITDTFRVRSLVLLVLSLVPFLTISLCMKVIIEDTPSEAAEAVISLFGKYGGSFLLLLLFILEIMGMIRISRGFKTSRLKAIGEIKLLTDQSGKASSSSPSGTEANGSIAAKKDAQGPDESPQEAAKKGLSLRFVKAADMQEGGAADHTDAPFPDFRFDLPVIPEPP
ncbi:MAG TPA: hypothetical protein PLG43_15375, partial [Spirochaetia bacterium]|nr:hypothetical protein [Spirochaetia bacterium]